MNEYEFYSSHVEPDVNIECADFCFRSEDEMDEAASMYMMRGFTKYQAKFLATALTIIVSCFLYNWCFFCGKYLRDEYFWKPKTFVRRPFSLVHCNKNFSYIL